MVKGQENGITTLLGAGAQRLRLMKAETALRD